MLDSLIILRYLVQRTSAILSDEGALDCVGFRGCVFLVVGDGALEVFGGIVARSAAFGCFVMLYGT